MNENLRDAKNKLIKDSIIKAAKEIIENNGLAALSIRKLAKKVGYSPAAIYQYYDSKSEIVKAVIEEGYQDIIKSIVGGRSNFNSVEEEIRFKLKNYINTALENKYYYQAVMLSEEKNILQFTAVLNTDLRPNQSALQLLIDLLKKGQKQGEFSSGKAENIAKVIWTATFGLISRMIIERVEEQKKQNELIESHFQLVFSGIRKK
ncbi:TetR family transcriptional regulator [Halanaerobium saccharolyticum]|jgi:AcrR family transcriptional regulator|uniref:TetR family transcriptional regulator n=1 Tax=Halanaerobium saccharolyticum TaxID=43595 RepID=A0A2T5RT38_9FIRM|nr:helix-turn-helix domain-containing protein [Halanaerobium saccharolyticum]PTW03500.1 TetR family transcriptional regulator [Halanaerobium saccharolyticum]